MRTPVINGAATAVAVWTAALLFGFNAARAQDCVDITSYLNSVEPLAVPDEALDVEISGDHAFIAAEDSGLVVVNIALPNAMQIVATKLTQGEAKGLTISANTVYIADWENGLAKINISQPSAPVSAGRHPMTGRAVEVVVSGSYAYVASQFQFDGLHIFDLGSPLPMGPIGSAATPDPANDVAVRGSFAYVATGNSGVQVVNIANRTAPFVANAIALPGRARGVRVQDDLLYVSTDSSIEILELSSPSAPSSLGSIPSEGAWDVRVLDGVAYVASGSHGLLTVDVSTPSAPVVRGRLLLSLSQSTRAIALRDGHAFLPAGREGLHAVDIVPPESPPMRNAVADAFAGTLVRIAGNTAYVATDPSGLRSFDLSDPGPPTPLGELDVSWAITDLVVDGAIGYATDDSLGLRVLDLSDPGAPSVIHGVEMPEPARGLCQAGDLLYVATELAGVQVVDISTSTLPQIIDGVAFGRLADDVVVHEGFAYVVARYWGIQVLDLSVPQHPVATVLVDVDQQPEEMAIVDDWLILAESTSRIPGTAVVETLDLSDPALPQLIGWSAVPGQALSLWAGGGYAYLACDRAGMAVFDITTPATPQLLGTIDTRSRARSLTRWGSTIVVADQERGLWTAWPQCGDATAAPSLGVLPRGPRIEEVWPNPFNPSTRIDFTLEHAGAMELDVFDAAGRHVRTLARETATAGRQSARWNGRDDRGRSVASGVYLVRLRDATGSAAQKLILLK